jgi:hypothetical protein
MNDQIDSKTHKPLPRKPPTSVSLPWRLTLLAAPSLVFLGAVLFFVIGFPITARIPHFALELLWVMYMILGGLFAFLGPIFGSYALVRSLNPSVPVNPFYVLLLWFGILVVNTVIVFSMCMTTLRFIGI